MLPFSREVYFYLFGQFNEQYLGAQVLGGFISLIIVLTALGWTRLPIRALWAGLALLWAGCGGLWFFRVFGPVNFMAPIYGYLACTQAIALGAFAIFSRKPQMCGTISHLAAFLFLLALAYPLADLALGPGWPNLRWPALNIEPLLCLTLGLTLQTQARWRPLLTIIPLLFALVTGYTAWVLPLQFDWLVLIAVILAGHGSCRVLSAK
jgi:hypothetical protein